jgi:hypothetical protein
MMTDFIFELKVGSSENQMSYSQQQMNSAQTTTMEKLYGREI